MRPLLPPQPRDELAQAFGAELGHSAAQPAYNVAPGQPIITVRFNSKTGVRSLDDLQWGLIPSFAKDPKIAWRTINARAETVDTSGMFRRAFEKRRCLIAVDGLSRMKAPRSARRALRGVHAKAAGARSWQSVHRVRRQVPRPAAQEGAREKGSSAFKRFGD